MIAEYKCMLIPKEVLQRTFDAYHGEYHYRTGSTKQQLPHFYSATGCFVVTLPHIRPVTQAVTQGVTQDVTQGVTQASARDMGAKMVAYIRANAKVTTAKLAELFNCIPMTIKRHLAKLSYVRYVGHGYSGHWEVDAHEEQPDDGGDEVAPHGLAATRNQN